MPPQDEGLCVTGASDPRLARAEGRTPAAFLDDERHRYNSVSLLEIIDIVLGEVRVQRRLTRWSGQRSSATASRSRGRRLSRAARDSPRKLGAE
jgi:hypothetical protein